MEGSIAGSELTVKTSEYERISSCGGISPYATAATLSSTHSQPSSSPRSSALPSPPDSPSGDSVSSFPSVTSSFFFSSAGASPPHTHSDHGHGAPSSQLIIPSLTLPTALRRPTVYGQTVGELKLLVLGARGTGKSTLVNQLITVDENEDVLDCSGWEECNGVLATKASTYWVEHRDAHGLEKFEPSKNVEVVELPGFDASEEPEGFFRQIKSTITRPFHTVQGMLASSCEPSSPLANLLASPTCPIYDALIFLTSPSPSDFEQRLMASLSPLVPIVIFPAVNLTTPTVEYSVSTSSASTSDLKLGMQMRPGHTVLSFFKPETAAALRHGLFRSPETLGALRAEAAERFLRWREAERAVDTITSTSPVPLGEPPAEQLPRWDRSAWNEEWERTLVEHSADVNHALARRRNREGTVTRRSSSKPIRASPARVSNQCTAFLPGAALWADPFHLPSLVMLSLSLFGTVGQRVKEMKAGWVLVGGFCAGVGVGLLIKSFRV